MDFTGRPKPFSSGALRLRLVMRRPPDAASFRVDFGAGVLARAGFAVGDAVRADAVADGDGATLPAGGGSDTVGAPGETGGVLSAAPGTSPGDFPPQPAAAKRAAARVRAASGRRIDSGTGHLYPSNRLPGGHRGESAKDRHLGGQPVSSERVVLDTSAVISGLFRVTLGAAHEGPDA